MGLKDISALVYLDDILIFSDTIQEHVKRIKNVFDRIRDANFKLNLGKCTFAAREVAYLGHIVSTDGIMADEGKVKAIRQFPLPRIVRDVRAFLGLAGYYRSFIKDFADFSKPLTLLTRKDTKFYWSDLQQKASDALKAALTSESVLAHPEFDKPFILSCDASNYAISAILNQDHNGKESPLSFASRILNQHEINYSTTEKELLAVVFGVRTHRCFLYGRKFKIITDHAALKWLITVKNHQCARLNRWVLKLAEYDSDIQHRPGKKHINADVLSWHVATVVRKHEVSQETGKETAEPPLTKEQIGQALKEDEYCKQIVKALTAGESLSYFLDQDSVLYYGKPDEKDRGDLRIVIPVTFREQVIRHQGLKRTQNYLKARYFWPTLMKDVEEKSGRPIIVTETQTPREQRDEIILDEGPEDLDDSRRDPTWRPGRAVQGQRETEVQNTEGELREPPRYYLRSSDKSDREASTSIEPQTIEPPREEQSSQSPIDFPTDENNSVRNEGGSQPPPYPYSLMRLPGRRN
jgi:hypothetical protein